MKRRAPRIARRRHGHGWIVALVDHAQRFDRAAAPVFRIRLVDMQAIDVEARDIDIGRAGGDPLRHDAAEAAAGEDADRIEPGRHKIALEFRRLADDRPQVRREALGAAEELADAHLAGDRHAAHRPLEKRGHAVPVGRQFAERGIVRYAFDLPRRTHRLEQADHDAPALLAVVAVGRGVFEHRHVGRQVLDGFGDQVVVLGSLVRHVDTRQGAKLPCPHAGAIDDVVRLDVAGRSTYAADAAAVFVHSERAHTLENLHAALARTLGQRHRHVDRIHAAVLAHVEPSLDIIDFRQREQRLDLARRNFLHVHPAIAIEGRDAPELLQPVAIVRHLDEPHRHETRRLPGFGFEALIEIARVLADLGRGLRGGTEGHHEPGRMPGGA